MSAKACQLCGKPLSRLRVGGDGEFCSREHRNQYGLRRGMDRLVEVDKVTSLMRRRENPRQISPARLMCNSALSNRGFLQSQSYSVRSGTTTFAPVFRLPEPPRLSSVADRYVAPPGTRQRGISIARGVDGSRIRIQGRASEIHFPAPARKLTTQVTQAPLAALRCRIPASSTARRDFPLLRQKGVRVHTGQEPAALRNILLPGTAALGLNLSTRKVGASPLEGNALRVSIGLGFNAPSISRRIFLTPPAMTTALVYPSQTRKVSPGTRDTTQRRRDLSIRIAGMHTSLPQVRGGLRPAEFVYPGAVTPGKQKPVTKPLPPARATAMAWTPSDPRTGKIGIPPTSAGFAKRNGVHLCTLTLAPSATNSSPQVVFRPFIPQEPGGYPTVPFVGATAVGVIAGPSAAVEESNFPAPAAAAEPKPAAFKLEEHFGSGWDNWEGGVQDWLVDVAGVRTGSLALFLPTLELVDYDLEFLARIDSKSLTWVVRATDLEEYVRCTLTAIPGGELEFSRAVVRGGVAEQVIVANGRIPGKPRSAMTVRTEVEGDTFTVSVDGKAIDTWQEARLYCGGIGFMGAPDDRARLYWVRISSTENIGKEQQKK